MKEKLIKKLSELQRLSDQDYPTHPRIYTSLGISKSYFYKLIRKLKDEGRVEPVEGQRVKTFTRFSIDNSGQEV